MNQAEQILVIILSSALAVFLVLGIISLVLLNRLLKSIGRLSAKAEEVGDAIEDSVKSFASARSIATIISLFTNRSKSKKG